MALTAECRDSFLKDVHCQLGTEGRPGLCIGTVQTEGPMFHYGGVYAPVGQGLGGLKDTSGETDVQATQPPLVAPIDKLQICV